MRLDTYRIGSTPARFAALSSAQIAALSAAGANGLGSGQLAALSLAKVAALGIKVSRHCTYHGVALNVAMDLEPFGRINPCGYAGLRTVDLSTIGVDITWNEAAGVLARNLSALLAP